MHSLAEHFTKVTLETSKHQDKLDIAEFACKMILKTHPNAFGFGLLPPFVGQSIQDIAELSLCNCRENHPS